MDIANLSLVLVLSFALLLAVLIGGARMDRGLQLLLLVALALRIAGAIVFREVVTTAYGGGDFQYYLANGIPYGERLRQLDFGMFRNADEWLGGTWWGSQFLAFWIGIVAALLGPAVLAQCIVFSLLSFAGLLCFGLAYHRLHPDVPVVRYLRWVLLFPALWFWPAVPSKEALLMLGAGLTTLGYVGRKGRVGWLTLGAGLFVVFGVRPQVALVFFAAAVLGDLLTPARAWTLPRLVQVAMLLAMAVVGSGIAMRSLGVEESGAAGVSAYLTERGQLRDPGQSNIETAQVSWRGVPLAVVNVWFRPFLWEARSATMALSALEILVLWGAVLLRHRAVLRALRGWRYDRLLRFAVPFLLAYSVSAGMTMWNLGIIARQRIPLFPFFFLLLETRPRTVGTRAGRRQPAGGFHLEFEPAPAGGSALRSPAPVGTPALPGAGPRLRLE